MIERRDPLFAVFGHNLRRADFQDFVFVVLYFVAIGSFTADGGLLQPRGGCKNNTSQDHFRSVNLYKEFPYRSESI